MWHPAPEELARLVDEPPTAAEAEHLAGCGECAAELEAMRAEHDALGALPRILPMPTPWEAMRVRLDRVGLLTGGSRRGAWLPGVAAALALFLAGAAAGVALAGGTSGSRELAVVSEPAVRAADDVPRSPGVETAATERGLDSIRPPAARPEPAFEEPEPRPETTTKLAARDAGAADETVRATDEAALPSLYGTPAAEPNWDVLARRASLARTPDEAARFVRDAESAYLAAMTRLAELTEAGSSNPAVRLATLDGIVVTTGAALERAPADPVINGYHLAARAQRDALLRTVSSSPAQDPWY